MISGIQSCSAKHPCPYCETDNLRDFEEKFEYRTFASINCSVEAYKAAGSIVKNAKNYTNCISEPLLYGNADDCIIDICAPP